MAAFRIAGHAASLSAVGARSAGTSVSSDVDSARRLMPSSCFRCMNAGDGETGERCVMTAPPGISRKRMNLAA
jgi:hypothetical protein